MARKDLLKGLMEPPAPTSSPAQSSAEPTEAAPPRVDPARPRYAQGAIGAVSASIADLKARSIVEIETDLIDSGGLQDRLDEDPAAFDALCASIGEFGQQVPVLLRPHPEISGRYQIVYGRRRVAALRALGLPVKAMLRDLDDESLILAQGQENSARRDLSFIEQASFARQMRDAGYERKIIIAALHVDKTVISRMLAVADAIPFEVIAAVGAAPAAGRDRWKKVADIITKGTPPLPDLEEIFHGTETSDDRFQILFNILTQKQPSNASIKFVPIARDEKGTLAEIKSAGKYSTLKIARDRNGFDTWLAANLEDIYQDWRAQSQPAEDDA